MNQELSRGLEIASDGLLYSIISWDEEVHYTVVTGVKRIKELLILEEV